MNFVQSDSFSKLAILCDEKLYESSGNKQKIEVYESKVLGKILALDGKAVMSEADGFIYHEMLAHVPICTHRDPKKVLLIGGGNGGVAHELLRHKDLQIDMVEIDEEAIEVSKKFFREYEPSDRLNLTIDDATKFIENVDPSSYDVIIVDSDNEAFYTKEAYGKFYEILKEDGLLATQGSSYYMDMSRHKEILKNMGEKFWIAMPYRYEMLCYHGIWNFIIASKKYHPTADIILQRADLIDGLKYYNSDIHIASFALPTNIDKELRGFAKK